MSQWQAFTFSSYSLQESGLRAQQSGLAPMCLCLVPFAPLCAAGRGWCSAALPWHSQRTRASGCISVCLFVAAGAELGAQEWALQIGGNVSEDVLGLLPRTCSGSSPSPWFEGVPQQVLQPRVLPGSRSPTCSAFSSPLPSTADPGDQLIRNLFCLEFSQVSFQSSLVRTAPKASGRRTQGSILPAPLGAPPESQPPPPPPSFC